MRRVSLAILSTLAVVACQGTAVDEVGTDQAPLVGQAESSAVSAASPAQRAPHTIVAGPNASLLRTASSASASSRPPPQEELIPGEIIVKVKTLAHATALHRGGVTAAQSLRTAPARALSSVLTRHHITGSHQILPHAEVEHLRRIVTLRGAADVEGAIRDLKALPDVEYAEPNRRVRAVQTPNDPYFESSGAWTQSFGDLWGLAKIQASTAWDTTMGSGAVVAVIDSGVDYTHPDIAQNLWTNPGETGLDDQGRDKRTNGVDDDGNGFVDDWQGYNFAGFGDTGGRNDPMDDLGHGTHVAGTIAAVGNNGIGITGVAPAARIMAVKALDATGSGSMDDVVRGIYYAANQGAHVINLSLGGWASSPIQALSDAIAYAHDDKGVVVVAAAGNNGADVGTELSGFSPANLRNTIAVAAADHLDRRASFSNFGVKLDVTAPGGGDADPSDVIDPFRSILSLLSSKASPAMTGNGALVVGTSYLRQAGTSMAAPHVAGVAALLHSEYPNYTPEQIRQAIRKGADHIESPAFDVNWGTGTSTRRPPSHRALRSRSVSSWRRKHQGQQPRSTYKARPRGRTLPAGSSTTSGPTKTKRGSTLLLEPGPSSRGPWAHGI